MKNGLSMTSPRKAARAAVTVAAVAVALTGCLGDNSDGPADDSGAATNDSVQPRQQHVVLPAGLDGAELVEAFASYNGPLRLTTSRDSLTVDLALELDENGETTAVSIVQANDTMSVSQTVIRNTEDEAVGYRRPTHAGHQHQLWSGYLKVAGSNEPHEARALFGRWLQSANDDTDVLQVGEWELGARAALDTMITVEDGTTRLQDGVVFTETETGYQLESQECYPNPATNPATDTATDTSAAEICDTYRISFDVNRLRRLSAIEYTTVAGDSTFDEVGTRLDVTYDAEPVQAPTRALFVDPATYRRVRDAGEYIVYTVTDTPLRWSARDTIDAAAEQLALYVGDRNDAQAVAAHVNIQGAGVSLFLDPASTWDPATAVVQAADGTVGLAAVGVDGNCHQASVAEDGTVRYTTNEMATSEEAGDFCDAPTVPLTSDNWP
jgi:hypothetical protein